MNGRTQPARDGDFSCRSFLNPRTAAPNHGSPLKKRPRSRKRTRSAQAREETSQIRVVFRRLRSAGRARRDIRGLDLARRQHAGLVDRSDRGRHGCLLLDMRGTKHAHLQGGDRKTVGLIGRQLGGESRGAARDRQDGGGDRQSSCSLVMLLSGRFGAHLSAFCCIATCSVALQQRARCMAICLMRTSAWSKPCQTRHDTFMGGGQVPSTCPASTRPISTPSPAIAALRRDWCRAHR